MHRHGKGSHAWMLKIHGSGVNLARRSNAGAGCIGRKLHACKLIHPLLMRGPASSSRGAQASSRIAGTNDVTHRCRHTGSRTAVTSSSRRMVNHRSNGIHIELRPEGLIDGGALLKASKGRFCRTGVGSLGLEGLFRPRSAIAPLSRTLPKNSHFPDRLAARWRSDPGGGCGRGRHAQESSWRRWRDRTCYPPS